VQFQDVFREQAAFVWRCLRRLGVSAADADDVCQEVFVVVYRKLDTFDEGASLRSWLYGICVRKASDHRRLAHKKRENLGADLPILASGDDPTRPLDERQARDFLDAVLERLDDAQRAVFVLYEIEQLPMADVAAAIDCPLQTAYSRLHAARKVVEAAVKRERARREGA
jgi:RNA polymerase sigma-70 factor, ECF subfamily